MPAVNPAVHDDCGPAVHRHGPRVRRISPGRCGKSGADMQNGISAGGTPAATKAPFLPSLNGGRAIAAFLVFGGHYLAFQFATEVGAAFIYEDGSGRGASDAFFFEFFGAFIP